MRYDSFSSRFLQTAFCLAGMITLGANVGTLNAQSANPGDSVQALSNSLLQLHGRARGVQGMDANSRREAADVIRKRAAALSQLIVENPGEALRQTLAAEAIDELATSFPDAAGLLESHGKWRGPVETVVMDSHDMKTQTVKRFLRHGGDNIEIHSAGDEMDTRCGDVVEVEGVRVGNLVAALKSQVVAAAAATACVPTGQQKIAVLMVTFPGQAPPVAVTAQAVRDAMTGTTGRSVDAYWREASYGKAWATADVFGWYTLDATYTCDQIGSIQSAALKAADADVYFPNYSRIMILFPYPASGCSYAGTATVGCSSMSSPGDGPFTASINFLVANYFINLDQGVKLATHEAGHNLGLMHSRSRAFAGEPMGAEGVAGTLLEYGDAHSTMGSWNFGHYTGYQKQSLGWQTAGSNVVTVQSSGTFTILPTELPSSGPQTLKIQRGTGSSSWLWVEYRQPIGNYDSTLNPQVFTGALIHYQDSITGTYTDLLDYTPGSPSFLDAALAQGQTWTDPYSNVSITVQSATPGGLTVTVNYAGPTCTPAAPVLTLSPLNPSVYSGNSVGYSASLTNRDSAGCPASTFSINSAQPAGWIAAKSVSSLVLAPGQSAPFTLTETVPAGTAPSTYPVSASAGRGSSSTAGNANCTVLATPPPPPPPPPAPLALSVTAGTSASSYAARSTVTMTAKVVSGTSPVTGVAVVFRMLEANGSTTSKNATTGNDGVASWSYKLGPKNISGTYAVTVSATYGTQTATSTPVAFSVK